MNVRRSLFAVSLAIFPLSFWGNALSAAEPETKSEAERELHAIGIYEGVEKTGNEIHGGRATVTVNRPGKMVTLVLTSYEPVTWEVKLAGDTKVEEVILGGYGPQAVKGVPENFVIKAFRGGMSAKYLYADYKIDSARFRSFVEQLAEFSKLPLSSFQGSYAYRHESPLVIDRVQDDPRLSIDYPKVTPLAELPDLKFSAVHYSATGDRIRGRAASYGDFTLGGPIIDSLKPLPAGIQRVAYDPDAKQYYGIGMHEVCEVDLQNQTATKMELGLDVPRLSWPFDLTFDTKRKRMLLVSLHGRGYLYAYEPAMKKWSALADRLQIAAMAYHPKHDSLYAITLQFGEEGGRPTLSQFNPQGALVNSTKLGDPIVPGSLTSRGPGASAQLIAADDYLVLITSPSQYGGGGGEGGPKKSAMYLIDPKTEKVLLTWKQKDE